jgi:hypothetical protein
MIPLMLKLCSGSIVENLGQGTLHVYGDGLYSVYRTPIEMKPG